MGDLSKHFSRWEFSCRHGCGQNTVDVTLINVLEDTHRHFSEIYNGVRVNIEIGNRCKRLNKKTKGASKDSQHVVSKAADIHITATDPYGRRHEIDPGEIHAYLVQKYKNKHGIGVYDTWVHIDSRDVAARWDKRSK